MLTHQTNSPKLIKEEKKDTTCIICWDENDSLSLLLKNNNKYITFCDCNTYMHDDCLKEWYYKSYSCPICRANLIYDPLFTNRLRIRRKIGYCIHVVYNIVKHLTNIVCVIVAWNIGITFLYNIYLSFDTIDVKNKV